MKYWTRAAGSQRASATVQASIVPEIDDNKLVFQVAGNRYLIFQPETLEEAVELKEQAEMLIRFIRRHREK